MKKTALFLICVLAFSIIASCAAQSEPDASLPEYNFGDNLGIDLDGYEFVFKVMNDFEIFFLPEYSASAYGDKILARYEETGKKFNAKIKVSESDPNQQLMPAAMAGLKYADLLDTNARYIYTNRDYVVGLNDLEDFDITNYEKWGPEAYLNTAKFGYTNYGFIAYAWGMPYPQYIGNLYFRQDVLNRLALENPQEYYENGTWTWDTFHDFCTRATTVDNTNPDNSVYGFVISDEMKFPRAWIISNGAAPVVYDERQGKYVYGLTDDRAVVALTYIKTMLDEGIGYHTVSDEWEKSAVMFKEGKTVFYDAFNKHTFVNAENHLANPNDFPNGHSWLPYPCGPSGTYGASTAQFWFTARFLTLVDNFDDVSLQSTVYIVNDLFEPLEGETTTSWRDNIKTNFFFDDLSFKYYIDLFEGGNPDYSAAAYDALWTNMPNVYRDIFSGKRGIAEAIDFYSDKIQADLDNNLNSLSD